MKTGLRSLNEYRQRDKNEKKYWILVPEKYVEVYETTKIHTRFGIKQHRHDRGGNEYYRMPDDVYTHKEYPTCTECKQKFVPVRGFKKKCLRCVFR